MEIRGEKEQFNKHAFACVLVASMISIIFGYGSIQFTAFFSLQNNILCISVTEIFEISIHTKITFFKAK